MRRCATLHNSSRMYTKLETNVSPPVSPSEHSFIFLDWTAFAMCGGAALYAYLCIDNSFSFTIRYYYYDANGNSSEYNLYTFPVAGLVSLFLIIEMIRHFIYMAYAVYWYPYYRDFRGRDEKPLRYWIEYTIINSMIFILLQGFTNDFNIDILITHCSVSYTIAGLMYFSDGIDWLALAITGPFLLSVGLISNDMIRNDAAAKGTSDSTYITIGVFVTHAIIFIHWLLSGMRFWLWNNPHWRVGVTVVLDMTLAMVVTFPVLFLEN